METPENSVIAGKLEAPYAKSPGFIVLRCNSDPEKCKSKEEID